MSALSERYGKPSRLRAPEAKTAFWGTKITSNQSVAAFILEKKRLMEIVSSTKMKHDDTDLIGCIMANTAHRFMENIAVLLSELILVLGHYKPVCNRLSQILKSKLL